MNPDSMFKVRANWILCGLLLSIELAGCSGGGKSISSPQENLSDAPPDTTRLI